jgi:hypothetical protein
MRESAACFHNLEWPPEGARLAGPVVWLRGWIVGKPGHDFIDVRVRHGGGAHLGVLGLPRTDLAAHFSAGRPWLPAEFILGVPAADGPVSLVLEAMDAHGGWSPLQTIALVVAPDGAPPPRVEGRLETRPEGTWTVRDAHHPFHGHLDDPGPAPALAHGRHDRHPGLQPSRTQPDRRETRRQGRASRRHSRAPARSRGLPGHARPARLPPRVRGLARRFRPPVFRAADNSEGFLWASELARAKPAPASGLPIVA